MSGRERRRKKASELPATGSGREPAHVGRAVAGCACLACLAHRRFEARDRREARRAVLDDWLSMEPMTVRVGETSTEALRRLLIGEE